MKFMKNFLKDMGKFINQNSEVILKALIYYELRREREQREIDRIRDRIRDREIYNHDRFRIY